jgi:DinB superfamily
MDRSIIERFAHGGPALRKANDGLRQADIARRIEPGTWSILELVVHLADTDAIAIDRMKRILTEENPTLLWADETAYVERLHCEDQSLEDASLLFELGRRQFARVLRKLDDSQFERVGTHNRSGVVSLATMVRMYADHLEHHLAFLLGKRKNLTGSLET